MRETILITGGAGYIGKVLLEKLIADESVEKIICIDKDILEKSLVENSKVIFIHKNLIEDWESEIKSLAGDLNITKVVHLAWQTREIYGNKSLQHIWNIEASKKLFQYFFKTKSTKTLVVFSTVALYGAYSENAFDDIFTEADPALITDYVYAEEKRIMEMDLKSAWNSYLPRYEKNENFHKSIYIIRPVSTARPFIYSQFMPGTNSWARQFISKLDIVNAVIVLVNSYKKNEYKIYNLVPDGGYIDAKEMGQILNKKVIHITPFFVRILCFFAWHLTRGKIPTGRGVWTSYSYPIIVDGTKITRDFDFKYTKNIRQAVIDN